MSVYIEYVILDNLAVTAIISILSYRVLRLSVVRWRVILCAVVGTAVSVIYPLLPLNFYVLILLKLLLFAGLSLILYAKRRVLFKGAVSFMAMTLLMGGAMFTVGFFVHGNAVAALTLPAFNFPLGGILLPILLLYPIIKRLISLVLGGRSVSLYTYKIELSVFDKTVSTLGFLDSGNMLTDEKSGLPVVILSVNLTTRILSDEQLGLILGDKGERIGAGAHYISYGTLSKSGRLLVVKAQKFRLYLQDEPNIITEVMLGLSFNRLKNEFDALLSPCLF